MSSHVFDAEAWGRLDVFNQMGNIGSEVGRALKAKEQGKGDRMESAFFRGMDLINATINSWAENNNPRYEELLIAREQFAVSILSDQVDETLEQYFMEFAIAARLNR